VQGTGGAALYPGSNRTFDSTDVIRAVQAEVTPYDRNLFRTEQGLSESLNRLHDLWHEIRNTSFLSDQQAIQAREAAAMVATARWMYATALERKESRGMHNRVDYPQLDAKQHHRLLSGGLDRVWVKTAELAINN
ncbi:MAG: FAD-binding protein, partial [Rhizonema sp. PD38]|nr:FAD-binding protein [Rhizonema sp. PD38]